MDKNELALIRLENFRRLNLGGPAETARALWGEPQQWSDVLHGRKSFGEKLARKIEEKLQKWPGWLDIPENAMASQRPWLFSGTLWDAAAGLDVDARRRAENLLRTHLGLPPVTGEPPEQVVPGGQAAVHPLGEVIKARSPAGAKRDTLKVSEGSRVDLKPTKPTKPRGK